MRSRSGRSAPSRIRRPLAEKYVSDLAKLQESFTAALKGLVDTGISNINYVKDTATAQFEDFTKRVEDIQKTAVSAN